MKSGSISAKKKRIKTLKAALAERRKHCEKCEIGKWECGYCAIPNFELQSAITRLEKELEE